MVKKLMQKGYRRVQSDEGQKEQLEDKNRQRIFEVFSQYSTGEIKNLNVLEDEVIKSYDAQFGTPPARELDEEKISNFMKNKAVIYGSLIYDENCHEHQDFIDDLIEKYQRGELFK